MKLPMNCVIIKVYIVLLHCRLNHKLRYISRSWRSRRYRLRPRDSRKFGADVPGHGMSISSTLTSNYRRVEKSETPNTEKIILSINSHLVQLDTNSKRKINNVSIVAHCVEQSIHSVVSTKTLLSQHFMDDNSQAINFPFEIKFYNEMCHTLK